MNYYYFVLLIKLMTKMLQHVIVASGRLSITCVHDNLLNLELLHRLQDMAASGNYEHKMAGLMQAMFSGDWNIISAFRAVLKKLEDLLMSITKTMFSNNYMTEDGENIFKSYKLDMQNAIVDVSRQLGAAEAIK